MKLVPEDRADSTVRKRFKLFSKRIPCNKDGWVMNRVGQFTELSRYHRYLYCPRGKKSGFGFDFQNTFQQFTCIVDGGDLA